jgi:hypothetical protein
VSRAGDGAVRGTAAVGRARAGSVIGPGGGADVRFRRVGAAAGSAGGAVSRAGDRAVRGAAAVGALPPVASLVQVAVPMSDSGVWARPQDLPEAR